MSILLAREISFDPYRKAFYSLYPGNWNYKIIDLGDIEKGETAEDTRFAAKEVIAALIQKKYYSHLFWRKPRNRICTISCL